MRVLRLWLIPIALLFITGCSMQPLHDNDLRTSVDKILDGTNELYNQTSLGYKYYLPAGFNLIGDSKNNQVIYHQGHKLYMFVDVISYYHKYQGDFVGKTGDYFSMELDHEGIKGYIEITRYENTYFVDMLFNYARIETFVPHHQLKSVVLNGLIILDSITFNDAVIMDLMGNNQNMTREEPFNLYQPSENRGNFLRYIETYDEYVDRNREVPDQDEIPVNGDHEYE